MLRLFYWLRYHLLGLESWQHVGLFQAGEKQWWVEVRKDCPMPSPALFQWIRRRFELAEQRGRFIDLPAGWRVILIRSGRVLGG